MTDYKNLITKSWVHFIINQKGIHEDLHKELIVLDENGYLRFLNTLKPNTPFNLSLISVYYLSMRAMAKSAFSGKYYCHECRTEHNNDDSFKTLKGKLSASTLNSLSTIETKYL